MIETIAHKGLRLLWEKNNPSKLPAEQVEKIKRILSVLNTAKTLDPIKAIPGYRLHQLSGDLKGYWAIWVTGNYRIVFQFEEDNVFDINYIDYH
ncbi:type II toxin-antitoxin system RelE/ParE family toxin [Dyadobacter sp. CY356]|uniref:type II toxin-antitoxin system RelE/ParE family toxin n=1 Tax=Dyadobacter sp. CY356 TaxID=2906442 RepID=UPI001F472E26|nr:type II toxin-antitoxin system mRNA interferase toxin, RelE/StbE family [Dyadobacter sp. CY356]MCF0059609.1 type II toxin-antitoxin system RelE/ParE family toxin [Dyadobacter sp. CY356]